MAIVVRQRVWPERVGPENCVRETRSAELATVLPPYAMPSVPDFSWYKNFTRLLPDLVCLVQSFGTKFVLPTTISGTKISVVQLFWYNFFFWYKSVRVRVRPRTPDLRSVNAFGHYLCSLNFLFLPSVVPKHHLRTRSRVSDCNIHTQPIGVVDVGVNSEFVTPTHGVLTACGETRKSCFDG